MSMAIEDVVKNLRYRAEGRRKSGKLLQIDDKMFDLIADDIETAIKREREAVGNAAKMRAALEAVYECAKDGVLTIRDGAFEKVVEALSSPPRNVDRFNTPDEALSAYSEDKGITQPLPLWYGNEFWAFIHWLFANAKEGAE